MLRARIYPIVWLLAVAGLGCDAAVAPRLWAVDDMVQLTPISAPPARGDVWDVARQTVRLFAAANETVSFQLVVDAPPGGLSGVSVSCGELSTPGNSLDPEAVRLFRMLPVERGEYPPWQHRMAGAAATATAVYDALVPAGGPRIGNLKLAASERLALWVDVAVPREAMAGQYRADIHVRYLGGQLKARLALKVYDFVLPDVRPVICVGGFSYKAIFRRFVRQPGPTAQAAPFVPDWLDTSNAQVRQGLVVLRQLMRLAHEHRLDLFDGDIHPLMKRDSDGKLVLQWADYDSIIKPYLDGSAFDDALGVAAWPAPLSSRWPDPADYGGPGAAAYRQTLAAIADQTAAHFRQLGMSKKLFAWLRAGGAGPEAYARHARLARAVRPAGDIPILSELPPTAPPASAWGPPEDFPQLADMYAPPADLAPLASATAVAQPGKPLTGMYLRPGRPPFVGSCGIFAQPADVRALPWIAMKYQCAGIFLPEALNWEGDPYQATAGEDRLFYPPPSELARPDQDIGLAVLPSVRLKWLRRGQQDVAYLWLLRQRQRKAMAEALVGTMVHYAGLDAAADHYQDGRLGGWVGHGPTWRAARRVLTDQINSAIHPNRIGTQDRLGQRLAWDKLQRQACRVRIERIRARFELLGSNRYRAVCRAELYNEMAAATEVRLQLTALPEGFEAIPAQRQVKLAPAGRAVVELAAEGDHVRTGGAAKMLLPFLMSTDLRGAENIPAEVPFLMVGHTEKKLTIDGSLRDWPMRPGNRAADFRLLGRRGWIGGQAEPGDQPGATISGRRRGLARRQTGVFALHDGENLYLAFRCQEPAPQSMIAHPTNIVRYHQLLAVGEDIVEVIADPGRSADDAAGLYRLIVKSNGVIVSQRGVPAEPPLGPVRLWPVEAKVAIAAGGDCWIVELAIPLAAFGPRANAPVWGVNFARFATARAGRAQPEASNWAGAARYYYHPQDLGTMYLVPKDGQVRLATTQPAGGAPRPGPGE